MVVTAERAAPLGPSPHRAAAAMAVKAAKAAALGLSPHPAAAAAAELAELAALAELARVGPAAPFRPSRTPAMGAASERTLSYEGQAARATAVHRAQDQAWPATSVARCRRLVRPQLALERTERRARENARQRGCAPSDRGSGCGPRGQLCVGARADTIVGAPRSAVRADRAAEGAQPRREVVGATATP